jgi:hypothetical protein
MHADLARIVIVQGQQREKAADSRTGEPFIQHTYTLHRLNFLRVGH